jgi:hypothetical protein
LMEGSCTLRNRAEIAQLVEQRIRNA